MASLRLALAARLAGDAPAERTALLAAKEALAPLQAAAPDWPSVHVAEGMLALQEGDETAAAEFFARAAACDRAFVAAQAQVQALVQAAGGVRG